MTQGRTLIAELKRRPHTYGDMLEYHISTAPWKRIQEALHHDERIVKGTRRVGARYLTTWRVMKA